MNKINKIAAPLLLLVLCVATIAAFQFRATGSDGSPQKVVGVLLPLSGAGSYLGEEVKDGISLAFSTIDKNQVDLKYEDTKDFSTLKAITSFKRLRALNSPNFFLGPLGPEATLGLAAQKDFVEAGNVYSISLCDSKMITFENLYCAYPSVHKQTEANLPMLKLLKSKRIWVITDKSPNGEEYLATLRPMLSLNKMDVIGESIILDTQKDFKTDVVKVNASNIDTLMIGTAPGKDIILLKQLKQSGFKGAVLFTGDKTEDELRSNEIPQNFYIPILVSKKYNREFVTKFVSTYHKEPTFYNALGYSVAAMAIEREFGYHMETAIPGYRYNENREAEVIFSPAKFENGKLEDVLLK